jgi:predicted nucleic acid-binding protein
LPEIFADAFHYIAVLVPTDDLHDKAMRLAKELEQSGSTFVTSDDRGLDLYERRGDKAYSLTDCMSMEICRERRIKRVLTHDHHFTQEGFEILL